MKIFIVYHNSPDGCSHCRCDNSDSESEYECNGIIIDGMYASENEAHIAKFRYCLENYISSPGCPYSLHHALFMYNIMTKEIETVVNVQDEQDLSFDVLAVKYYPDLYTKYQEKKENNLRIWGQLLQASVGGVLTSTAGGK